MSEHAVVRGSDSPTGSAPPAPGEHRFGLPTAMLSGAAAGLGAIVLELFMSGNIAKSLEFNVIYGVCVVLSGAVLAGVVGHYLVRALAATGALDRFAAGRERRQLA